MNTFKLGDRVRTCAEIEIFPLAIFPAGLTGTVTEVSATFSSLAALVHLDQHFPALIEWNNELQVWHDGTDESDCTLSKFELIGDAR